MTRRDLAVAAGTSAGNGLLILMRTMTAHALRSGVNDDRGHTPLCLMMTARAVLRGVRRPNAPVVDRRDPAVSCRLLQPVVGECVAVHAVCMRSAAEALFRRPRCVLDMAFRFMARRAARWKHCANRALRKFVTAIAGQALVDHVRLVAGDPAIFAPLLLDVETLTGGTGAPIGPWRGRRTGHECGQGEHGKQPESGEPKRVVHCETTLMQLRKKSVSRFPNTAAQPNGGEPRPRAPREAHILRIRLSGLWEGTRLPE